MTRTKEIYEALTAVFREVFEEDDITIGPETTADQIEGWDSLTNVRLMLTVERAFGVRFSAAQTSSLANVGELAALIERKSSERKSS